MCAESHSKSVTELEGTQALLLHCHDSHSRCHPCVQLGTLPLGWGWGRSGGEGCGGGWALTPVAPSPRDPRPLDYSVYTLGGLRQHRPQHRGARAPSGAGPHSQHGGRCGDHSDGQLSARSDPRHRRQSHPSLLLHPGRRGCWPRGLHCLQKVRGGPGAEEQGLCPQVGLNCDLDLKIQTLFKLSPKRRSSSPAAGPCQGAAGQQGAG